MGKLVFIKNNRLITDSLTIADTFSKEHRNVLADVENQIEKLNQAGEGEWGVLNFQRTQYQHPQNKQWYPKFDLTEDAFAIIAMSYVTPESMKMKVRFLQEFKEMREQLNTSQFALPQTFSEALRALADSEEEKQTLQSKIESDKPLVLFAESLQVSKDSILIADLAKVLKQNGFDIGEMRLFRWMREEGYLIKSGSEYNMPTQRSMELKIMEIKTGSRSSSDGTTKITRTPKITGKGQIYFINKFKNEQQRHAN